MTPQEQAKLEKVLLQSDHPLAVAIYLDLYTGLRVGELLALRIEDFDFDKKELHIKRAIARAHIPETKKTELIVDTPKTNKSIRTIPLTDFIISKLKAYIDRIEADKKQLRELELPQIDEKWFNTNYLFYSISGKPYESGQARRVLDALLEQAGVKHINFHALRHTFASRAVESGFDIKSLSDILGHTDARMTLNTYTHSLAEQKRLNMEKLSVLSESLEDE